ncbi:MAG: bifunctional phosphoribosylaminoimidazolecarboxamide formyltransferase/inosine monophosphate cyclohydrolase [Ignavibacteriales bacterium CG_4_9_14_3_um_filter_30_11]|nr:MAG: bifunctional phosphoribosylaminoimidazolecarboxamide formyltransferase/inosine monophosphate cyclohydrolase [Ignavibacteriales bacterium CG_4_9_14_3_um_filter_30_11]
MKKIALISVSDKTDVTFLGRTLSELGYDIIATGNTSKILRENGIKVIQISDITGFPEVFDGRVKTLHPKIFGGILFRRENKQDQKELEENEISPIDIVCVNLYPFEQTIAKEKVSLEETIENIDIGGPSLIRAAAKNYNYVSVLTNPTQYKEFIKNLKKGEISIDKRKELAAEAFSHTAKYDTVISNHLENIFDLPKEIFRINIKKEKKLRYGENPHQSGTIYGTFNNYFDVFYGKEISYNNIIDLISAAELAEEIGGNACTIIKHCNPAGAAQGETVYKAFENALKCDPVSAFGGIVVFTKGVDRETAEKLNDIFLEIICAPSYSKDALSILTKKKNRRLVKQLKSIKFQTQNFRNIPGGVIVQSSDDILIDEKNLKVVTKKQPTKKEMEDLMFAWKVAKHTKSNAIVFAKDKAALGVGAGQMSRLDSSKIAKMKANEHGLNLKNSVAASDAFFPFADGLLEIINCGATSVIQPGGSVRDQEVIAVADENNISMVFTGIRHFKH